MNDVVTNFVACAAILFICLFILWLISLKIKNASIIDIFWGAGFAIVALVCLTLSPVKTPYIMLLAALPIIWGVRLTVYLAKRNLGHGEDYRYVAMRERSGLSERQWRRRAFFTIFLGQGLLILIISAPVWWSIATAYSALNPNEGFVMYLPLELSRSIPTSPLLGPFSALKQIGAVDISTLSIIGATIWLVGFLFEAIGDAQLAAFKRKNADYNGPYADKPVLDTGLWKYTRHPNYFGNSMIWWGIWLVACQAPWGVVTIFSPLIMNYLLVRVSGKDLLEKKLKTRPAYQAYVERTSGFIPQFPKAG